MKNIETLKPSVQEKTPEQEKKETQVISKKSEEKSEACQQLITKQKLEFEEMLKNHQKIFEIIQNQMCAEFNELASKQSNELNDLKKNL